MAKYFLRIIADSCVMVTETETLSFLRASDAVTELRTEPMQPYRKNPGQGELLCSFVSDYPAEDIRASFADHWEGDVADAQWSQLHLPHSTFLWLTL